MSLDPARLEQMNLALDHAGDDWRVQAYTFLCGYARSHAVFCGEDVSDAHIAAKLPQPPDLRAWGALYRHAVNELVVERLDNNGWSKRRSSPCPRYRSLVCMAVAA